jgi:hypothetical protein
VQVFAHSTQMLAVGRAVAAREEWGPGRRDRSAVYRSYGSSMKGCREIAREGQSPGTDVSFTLRRWQHLVLRRAVLGRAVRASTTRKSPDAV